MTETYSPIPELNSLNELQDELGFENYAEGFGLTAYGDTWGLRSGWSKDPQFLSRLIPFGQANGSGSFYSLWRIDDRSNLATLPVVVFGDEGGRHVVAQGLTELLQLLGYDCEISVEWDSAYFFKTEDQEPSEAHEEFVAWLAKTHHLAPAYDPMGIVAEAQAEFGERFAAWLEPFLTE
jgi:hypothetical protein